VWKADSFPPTTLGTRGERSQTLDFLQYSGERTHRFRKQVKSELSDDGSSPHRAVSRAARGAKPFKGTGLWVCPFCVYQGVPQSAWLRSYLGTQARHSSSPLKPATQARNLALELAAVPPSVRKASGFPETSKTLRGFASAA